MFEPDKKQEWVAKNKEKRVYCELLAKRIVELPRLAQIRNFFPIDKHTSSHLLQSLLRFTTMELETNERLAAHFLIG